VEPSFSPPTNKNFKRCEYPQNIKSMRVDHFISLIVIDTTGRVLIINGNLKKKDRKEVCSP
jgi:tartrate dehydratase beta subunit/fumarate hydratase class I family protein